MQPDLFVMYNVLSMISTRSDSREIERPVFDCFRGDGKAPRRIVMLKYLRKWLFLL